MKTLTLSVADDLYQQANQKATELDTSLRDVMQDLLVQWTTTKAAETTLSSYDAEQRRKELDKLFAMADAKPKLPGSVGSLNREELYQREQGSDKDDRAALVARLELLFAEADARDHDKLGSAGPFSREELYAERLNRFR